MQIVGIAGLPRSGKDTLAELFMADGWFGVSFGDIIRDQSRQRHADQPDPISVKNMTETANYLRTQHGADYVLKQALARFEAAQKDQEYAGVLFLSVRAPVEADFILEHHGRLVWVEASDADRHARSLQNLRDGEVAMSLEEMKAQEALQAKPQPGIPAEVQMNITYIKEHATDTLSNDGSKEEFLEKAHNLIKQVG